MTNTVDIEIYSAQSDVLGEGPIWSASERALYWLDIGRKRLYRRAPSDSQSRSWNLQEYPGCLAELTDASIAIAMGDGLYRFDLRSSAIKQLATVRMADGARFNDGKVDPCGRFWVGTMQNNFAPDGAPVSVDRAIGVLYRFDAHGRCDLVEEQIGISNTLAWSPDRKRFYFADSMQERIHVYDFDAESGALSDKRVLFDKSGYGIPDGSAIDVDGCLWNARWDGGAILRITPAGSIDRVVTLPVPRPTSCIFGGPNFDTLFVTSARNGLSPEQLERWPQSGSVFAIRGLGQGMPVPQLVHRAAG